MDCVLAHLYNLFPSTSISLTSSAEVVLAPGSGSLRSLQVRDEVEKYTQGKTTSSMYMEVNPGGLQLPSVTLCPGFKQGVFESVASYMYPHILKMRGRNRTMPTTEEDIQGWYKARTYNLNEGITSKHFQIVIHLLSSN